MLFFLLSYRALAREIFAKSAFLKAGNPLREADKGKNIFEQVYHQEKTSNSMFGAELGGNDLKYQKEIFDNMLTTNN